MTLPEIPQHTHQIRPFFGERLEDGDRTTFACDHEFLTLLHLVQILGKSSFCLIGAYGLHTTSLSIKRLVVYGYVRAGEVRLREGAPPLHGCKARVIGSHPSRPLAFLRVRVSKRNPQCKGFWLGKGNSGAEQEKEQSEEGFALHHYSDPIIDVASFCAQLLLLAARGKLDEQRAEWICQRFIEGYESASGSRVDAQKLNWYVSALLLRLSIWPFRFFENNWPERVLSTVNRAFAWERRALC